MKDEKPRAHTVRINPTFNNKIKKIWANTTHEIEKKVETSEVINACLYKFLEHTTAEDVKEYRSEILGKEN